MSNFPELISASLTSGRAFERHMANCSAVKPDISFSARSAADNFPDISLRIATDSTGSKEDTASFASFILLVSIL